MVKVFRITMEWGSDPNNRKEWNVDILARDEKNAREVMERSLLRVGMGDARILSIWELVQN